MNSSDYLEQERLYREIPANQEGCSVCGDSYYWWELREEGRCPTCDLRERMPNPPLPPPLAQVTQVIHINAKRDKE